MLPLVWMLSVFFLSVCSPLSPWLGDVQVYDLHVLPVETPGCWTTGSGKDPLGDENADCSWLQGSGQWQWPSRKWGWYLEPLAAAAVEREHLQEGDGNGWLQGPLQWWPLRLLGLQTVPIHGTLCSGRWCPPQESEMIVVACLHLCILHKWCPASCDPACVQRMKFLWQSQWSFSCPPQ